LNHKQYAHLVLGAGGLGGLSYIGACKALQAKGFEFKSVSGISAGSYFAALIAAGFSPEELEQAALNIDLKKLRGRRVLPSPLDFLAYLRWPFARYKEPRLPAMFRKLMGGDPCFKDLDLFYQTMGVDVANNRMLIYSRDTHPDMRVSEAIRISTSLPFFHPPHENKGRIVIDPAVFTLCPLWLAGRFADPFPIIGLFAKYDRARRRYYFPLQYLNDVLQSSAESHDYYYSKQISRAHLLALSSRPMIHPSRLRVLVKMS
jgi:predicted acylesterase/phospholipase RssA